MPRVDPNAGPSEGSGSGIPALDLWVRAARNAFGGGTTGPNARQVAALTAAGWTPETIPAGRARRVVYTLGDLVVAGETARALGRVLIGKRPTSRLPANIEAWVRNRSTPAVPQPAVYYPSSPPLFMAAASVTPFPKGGRPKPKQPTSSTADDATWSAREQILLRYLEKLAGTYPWAARLLSWYALGSVAAVLEDIARNREQYWRDYKAWEEKQQRSSVPVIRAPPPGRIPRERPKPAIPPGGRNRGPLVPRPNYGVSFDPIVITAKPMPVPKPRPVPRPQPKLEPVIVTVPRMPVPAPAPRPAPLWQQLLKIASPYIDKGLFPTRQAPIKLKGFPGFPDTISLANPLTSPQFNPLSYLSPQPQPAAATAKCKCPTKRKKSGKPSCRNPRVSSRTYVKNGVTYRSTIRRLQCRA